MASKTVAQLLSDLGRWQKPLPAALREALPPASCLAISHVAAEGITAASSDAAAAVYRRSSSPGGTTRTRDQIMEFFGDYRLLAPDWSGCRSGSPATRPRLGTTPNASGCSPG